MKQRMALQGLLGLCVGIGAGQQPRVQVASKHWFTRIWSHVNFQYLGKPATVIRVPKPQPPGPQHLQVGPDFYLAGYLRECPHNGCEVRFHPSAENLLICYCHGSLFRRADGRLEAGVANEDLPGLRLALEGEQVVVVGLTSA
ncbi:MAG: Rieske 2Fe-2S domain-containing protein [Meiothermus sp.]|uniref:Rieske 2Fe-2S domain-containing protein n=1 Tax=Meiothermus sp. TaxID=1955249 RepID=UPI0025D0909B|nr:Rieske 2Fe-2S domain-containing protein [Meiothermus sp.]MCS7069368.1 Rieske 2Fe-2S domain-containing protein [Meiothermus sp.]